MSISLLLLFTFQCLRCSASPLEGKLYVKLLEDYQPLERPVANSSEPVKVKMGLVLQQIISIDEKNQVVDVNAWMKLSWYDYSLKWDVEEYGGVTDLRFKRNQLWTPDVLMYNSANPHFDSTYDSNLLVYPDGNVNWIPPGIFRLSCRIAVAWFPFDIQRCFMKFGSWTFDGSKLDLDVDKNGLDLSTYIANGEWRLISSSAVRNIQYYQCCPEPYYDIVFTFVLRRRVLYYAFNLILPCFLITILSLIGFTLPPDAGEKMSLQITVMLSICIFQNSVVEMSPPTSEAVPFLGAFFAMCMLTCACCVTATTIALNLHNRTSKSHKMNKVFRQLMLNWLPWLLCMHRPGYRAADKTLTKIDPRKEFERDENLYLYVQTLMSKIIVQSPQSSPKVTRVNEMDRSERTHLWRNSSIRRANMAMLQAKSVSPAFVAQLLFLQQIYAQLASVNNIVCAKEVAKLIDDDWKYAAMVVDRVCLWVFTIFMFGSTIALFASVPQMTTFF